MSNVYVNLVATLDLSYIHKAQQSTPYCKELHKYLHEGSCIDKPGVTDAELELLDHNIHMMNGMLHKLASKWYQTLQDQNRKDIAIQMQPFQIDIGPKVNIDFFDSLECFHPSALGQSLLATGLWNSMLCTNDREGRCDDDFNMHMVARCPTAESVFYVGPDVIPDVEKSELNIE